MTLPTWMRRALLATGVMNAVAAILFLPPSTGLRALAGFPPAEQPVYLATVALFVFLFGVGYLWAGLTGLADPLFIALGAVGKASFVAIVTGYWLAGTLPALAPFVASADLLFAALFFRWLFAPS